MNQTLRTKASLKKANVKNSSHSLPSKNNQEKKSLNIHNPKKPAKSQDTNKGKQSESKTNGKKTLDIKSSGNQEEPKKLGVRKSVIKATSKIDQIAKARITSYTTAQLAINPVIKDKKKNVQAIKNLKASPRSKILPKARNIDDNSKSKSVDIKLDSKND